MADQGGIVYTVVVAVQVQVQLYVDRGCLYSVVPAVNLIP